MGEWPEYANESLGDGRTWSATFDSWDERTDTAYYLVTLSDGGQAVATFMVQISAAFSSDKPSDSEIISTLRNRIAQVAATGKANTTYRGPVMRM